MFSFFDQREPEGGWYDAQIDIQELIPGYKMLFESNYEGALSFFQTSKDKDIRFLMAYSKVLVAKYQIQTLNPHDQVTETKNIAIKRIFELLGYEANLELDFAFPKNEEQKKLFCWALSEYAQLEWISYTQNIPCLQLICERLQKARIQINRFLFDLLHWKIYWSSELNNLFQLSESEDLKLKYENVCHQEKLSETATEEQFNPLVNILLYCISPINIQSSQDVYDMFSRLCLLKQMTLKTKFKNGKFFAAAQKMIPKFDLPFFFHGYYLYDYQKYSLSIKYYQKAISLNNQNSLALNNLGLAHLRNSPNILFDTQANKGLVHESFKKAINLNPFFAEFHANLGMFYKKMQIHKDAIESILRALKLDDSFTSKYIESIMNQFQNLERNDQFRLIKGVFPLIKNYKNEFQAIYKYIKRQYPFEFIQWLEEGIINSFTETSLYIIKYFQEFDKVVQKILTEEVLFLLNQRAFLNIMKEQLCFSPAQIVYDLYHNDDSERCSIN